MTLAVAMIALVTGWAWFDIAGRVMVGPITVWVAMFVAVLATAVLAALRSGDRRCLLGAAVLVGNFVVWHFAWQSNDPVLIGALADVVTAGWFILAGTTRWEFTIGGLCLASLIIGVATQFWGIPLAVDRPLQFLAWSHPDLTSLFGQLASIVLGVGAGDSGLAARRRFAVRPVVADHRQRMLARIRAVATGQGQEG